MANDCILKKEKVLNEQYAFLFSSLSTNFKELNCAPDSNAVLSIVNWYCSEALWQSKQSKERQWQQ